MSVSPRPFPPVLPHGDLREVLPGIHFVTGTIVMPTALPLRFSRNMTVVCEDGRVVLVNTVRLDDRGLAALDALGKVTDIVRVAGNHGMDDPFYKDRYGARVWAVRGQRYTAGFGPSDTTYFTPDVEMDASTTLPLAGAQLYTIDSKPPEGLLRLDRHGGVVIAGDCLQHITGPDAYFNWVARPAMRVMGFMKPHNVGPAWLKSCKPPKPQLAGILKMSFANVLPAHGQPVLGEADARFRPGIERVSAGA